MAGELDRLCRMLEEGDAELLKTGKSLVGVIVVI